MIHYILIPEGERRALRREYRLRITIVAFLFVSCALVVGIGSLLPVYIFSYGQEREAILREEAVRKSRIESGADQIEKDLIITQAIAERILAEKDPVSYTGLIQKILSYRKKEILVAAFEFTKDVSTSTLGRVSVQGKALSREALLEFKKSIEGDKTFTDIELPLSDLAKSKNLDFNLRFKIRKQ